MTKTQTIDPPKELKPSYSPKPKRIRPQTNPLPVAVSSPSPEPRTENPM